MRAHARWHALSTGRARGGDTRHKGYPASGSISRIAFWPILLQEAARFMRPAPDGGKEGVMCMGGVLDGLKTGEGDEGASPTRIVSCL